MKSKLSNSNLTHIAGPVYRDAPGFKEKRFIPNGDIFESKCHFLVNPVNCIGVSGVLAGAFARRFPDMERYYKSVCNRDGFGQLQPGRVLPYYSMEPGDPNILLFPTMRYPGSESNLHDITRGLIVLRGNWNIWGIRSIAFPKIGCGVGGLKWEAVRSAIDYHLGDLPIGIELYGPEGVNND